MPDLNLTPAGWLKLLNRKLDAQAAAVRLPEDYYNGRQRLAFATAKFREAFSRYFPPLANNWMRLIVEAPVSRLKVTGFRFDPDPDTPSWDIAADKDAWALWQENNLDALSMMAHREAVKVGLCNLLVTPPAPGTSDQPLITVELASQSYVLTAAENRRKRLAAIKRWVDEGDDYAYCYLYLPDVVYRFRSAEKVRYGHPISDVQWTRVQGDDPVLNNPIGVVPMIPLENTPDLRYGGRSDLEVGMPIQDAVNKYCLDMQVSSEFHAYPQRYATGWEDAVDTAGRPIPASQVEMIASQTRLWRAVSAETEFGQLEAGDVSNYIRPIEMYVDHLAALTQTPAYYLKGQMANLSAEALHAADAGLVDRCEAKINGGFSDGWEDVMRVAFLAKGDTKRGNATNAEALWADPERKSLAQTVDAAVKMRTSLSVPLEMCWELLGWSPEKIRQAKSMMNLPDTPPRTPAVALQTQTPGGVILPGAGNGAAPPRLPSTQA